MDSLPQNLDFLLLEDLELINYSALKKSAELLCPEISPNHDLFDEVCCLQRTLSELSSMASFESLTLDQRWASLTRNSYPCIGELLSTISAIPASNASCERVFVQNRIQNRISKIAVQCSYGNLSSIGIHQKPC